MNPCKLLFWLIRCAYSKFVWRTTVRSVHGEALKWQSALFSWGIISSSCAVLLREPSNGSGHCSPGDESEGWGWWGGWSVGVGWGWGWGWVGRGNWRFADFYPINISDLNVGQGWVGRSYESCGRHQRLCGAAFVPLQRSIAKMGEIRLAQLCTWQPAGEMQAPLCIRSLL